MKLYEKSQLVDVSYFDELHWWRGTAAVHVAAGTSLPPGCTEILFTPSADGQTGKYHPETQTWIERTDRTGTPYWTAVGERKEFILPDDTVPAGCTLEAPPEYDSETQIALFQEGAWVVRDSYLSKPYWDADQIEHIVTDPYWECSAEYTLTPPHAPAAGYVLKLVNSEWEEILDRTGTKLWNRATGEERIITEADEQWDDQWTEVPPPSAFHTSHDGTEWILNEELLASTIRLNRDAKIDKIYIPAIQQLSRWIDGSEDDSAAQAHYKAQRAVWHDWAEALCDLPTQSGFPWPIADVPWPPEPVVPEKYSAV